MYHVRCVIYSSQEQLFQHCGIYNAVDTHVCNKTHAECLGSTLAAVLR